MATALSNAGSLVGVFLKSKSLRAALAFGLSGIGFSLATLLLARYLPDLEFGMLALFLALIQVGLAVGPAGADLVINRRTLGPSARMAVSIGITGALAASAITIAASRIYAMPDAILPALWLALLAASVSRIGAAFFQSRNRINAALGLTQSHNYLLLLSVPLAIAVDAVELRFFAFFIAVGYLITACIGWYSARGMEAPTGAAINLGAFWREGLSGMGIGLAALLIAQAERFVIPITLTYRELAEFGVLAAVAIAPFRMMQIAVGFTLLPRLRAAATLESARTLIRHETYIAGAVGTAAGAVVLLLAPWIVELFVGDKYELPASLFAAAVAVGWVRMAQSVGVATVNALGRPSHLAALNGASWLALLIALAGAWSLADYGLLGIVLGVGIGWLAQTLAAIGIGRHAFSHADLPGTPA